MTTNNGETSSNDDGLEKKNVYNNEIACSGMSVALMHGIFTENDGFKAPSDARPRHDDG